MNALGHEARAATITTTLTTTFLGVHVTSLTIGTSQSKSRELALVSDPRASAAQIHLAQ